MPARYLRGWIRELRELVPPIVPVQVRRVPYLKACGDTRLWRYAKTNTPAHFTIRLRSDMTAQETFDTLLHEWAHALAWNEGHNTTCDHDAEWGVALSRVYSEMHRD